MEAGRGRDGNIAVGHPNLLVRGDSGEQPGIHLFEVQQGKSEFALVTFADVAAEKVGEQVLAVADAEDRNTCFEDRAVQCGAFVIVDAAGAA